MHERIKSLHDSGKGYRTIAKLLNAEGSRTAKNKEWKNTNVYAVLKRYAERQARLERQSYTSEMKFSNCLLYTSPSPRDRQKSRMPSSA